MACPTCGGEQRRLNAATIYGDYTADYCERCGTLVESDGPEDPREPAAYVPKLAERCRALELNLRCLAAGLAATLGVSADDPKDDRPEADK